MDPPTAAQMSDFHRPPGATSGGRPQMDTDVETLIPLASKGLPPVTMAIAQGPITGEEDSDCQVGQLS